MSTKKCKAFDLSRTEFMLHKSQRTLLCDKNTLDYTECRLKKQISESKESTSTLILSSMLKDYLLGHVVIAWEHGKPIYLRVTKV